MVITPRRLLAAVVCAGTFALLVLIPRFASADRPLGVHTLNGTYSGSALEIRHDPGSDIEFCEIVGTAVADGAGNISLDAWRNCSLGGLFHDVESGTYSVSPTGVVVFALGSPDGGHGIISRTGEMVIIDNLDLSAIDPNVLVHHGVFTRVF